MSQTFFWGSCGCPASWDDCVSCRSFTPPRAVLRDLDRSSWRSAWLSALSPFLLPPPRCLPKTCSTSSGSWTTLCVLWLMAATISMGTACWTACTGQKTLHCLLPNHRHPVLLSYIEYKSMDGQVRHVSTHLYSVGCYCHASLLRQQRSRLPSKTAHGSISPSSNIVLMRTRDTCKNHLMPWSSLRMSSGVGTPEVRLGDHMAPSPSFSFSKNWLCWFIIHLKAYGL